MKPVRKQIIREILSREILKISGWERGKGEK